MGTSRDLADARPTALSLFSGVGGLDLGLELAFDARTVGYVEWQASAAAILLARMEDQALEPAPVWCGDITDFDGRPWAGVVDIVCGGFPCQDLSVAGKRAGIDGERSGLWAQMARICGEVRPRLVCIENVSGLLADEPMRRVLGDLAALGLDAQWGSLRASAVGAPHRRERVFIVATRVDDAGRQRRQQVARGAHGDEGEHAGRTPLDGDEPSGRGEAVAHDHGREGKPAFGLRRAGREPDPDRCDTGMADAGGTELQGQHAGVCNNQGRQEQDGPVACEGGAGLADTGRARPSAFDEHGPASRPVDGSSDAQVADACGMRRRQGAEVQRPGQPEPEPPLAIFPPGPADGEHWRDVLDRHPWLAPALDPKAAEPVLRRMADGMAAVVGSGRADALRAVGNGVVALQGAVALSVLADRLAGDSD